MWSIQYLDIQTIAKTLLFLTYFLGQGFWLRGLNDARGFIDQDLAGFNFFLLDEELR